MSVSYTDNFNIYQDTIIGYLTGAKWNNVMQTCDTPSKSIFIKHILVMTVLSVTIFFNKAYSINLPEYTLSEGETVVTFSHFEQSDRGRLTPQNQQSKYTAETYIRMLSHIEKSKRKNSHPEYLLFVPYDRHHEGIRANPQKRFKKDNEEGLMLRYHRKDNDWIIVPEDGKNPLTAEQTDYVEDIANGNILFNKLIKLGALQDYTIGEPVSLTQAQLESYLFGETGTLVLKDVKRRWEKDVAEFHFNVTYSTEKNQGECSGMFWNVVNTGQPIHFAHMCHVYARVNNIDYSRVEYLSKSYTYPNKSITDLAPRPLPALQPAGEITGLAFSDALEQLVIVTEELGTENNHISFWDMHQRKFVNTQPSTGRHLALTSDDKVINTISPNTRMIEAMIKLTNGYARFGGVADLNLEKDITSIHLYGRYPVSINETFELEVWNPGHGKIDYRYAFKHSRPIHMALSEDGRLLTIDQSGNVYKHTLTIRNICDTEHTESYCNILSVSFTESNTPLLTIESIPEAVKNGKEIKLFTLHPTEPHALFCYEDREPCGLVNYRTKRIVDLLFATVAHFDNKNRVLTDYGIHDLDGQFIKNWRQDFTMLSGSSVSDTFNVMFTQGYGKNDFLNRQINIHDLKTGERLHTIEREVFPVHHVHEFFKGVILFVTGPISQKKSYLLNLSELIIEPTPLNIPLDQFTHNRKGWSFAKAVNKNLLIPASQDKGKVIEIPGKIADYVFKGNQFFYAINNTIRRVDLKTRKDILVHTMTSKVFAFELFNDDGAELVAQMSNGYFYLPHAKKSLKLPFYSSGAYRSITYDQHSQTFFVSGLTGTNPIYNNAIEITQQYDVKGNLINEMNPLWISNSVLLSHSNGELWSGTQQGDIVIWDKRSGLVKERFKAHDGIITQVIELEDEKVITASTDGTIKIWRSDIPMGKFSQDGLHALLVTQFLEPSIQKRVPKLVSTIIVDINGEFIISSPDGYYYSTPQAIHSASFINGKQVFDYTQYDFWLNRPDIVLNRLNTGASKSKDLWKKLVDYRQARQATLPNELPKLVNAPQLLLNGPKVLTVNGSVSVAYEATGASQDTLTMHLLVNEVPIYGSSGLTLNQSKGQLDIALMPGINKIKAYLSNKEGIRSRSAFLTYNANESKTLPNLYVLSIGVSDYKKDEIDLKWARKDAEDLVKTLKTSPKFQKVNHRLIIDEFANRDAIIKAKSFLNQSKPNDVVVVFFAGHGFLDNDNNYFFGTNDIDPRNPIKHGLTYDGITSLLDGIPARKKLLMLDTCHSGEVVEPPKLASLPDGVVTRGIELAEEDVRDEANLGLSFDLLRKTFVDLRENTGAIVISAAGGQEYALEKGTLKNGVFTYSVIEALTKDVADTNKDGNVSVSELRNYTYDNVKRLTNGAQQPTTRNNNLDIDFSLF